MPGTKAGAAKAVLTTKAKHGEDFFKRAGKNGGKAKSPYKGFGSNKDLAREVGQKGGRVSRPPKKAVETI